MRSEDAPLAGVKVADFCWQLMGPVATSYLADFGAEVVKVESSSYPDVTRVHPPFKEGVPGLNRSALFLVGNNSKRSLSLDMNHPRAKEVARRLILWADLVVENFRPGQMGRWGIDYESIREFKPDIIMVSGSVHGQTGPGRGLPGYGFNSAAEAGFVHLTGWPDRVPCGTNTAYIDPLTTTFMALALVAALDYRDRTGRGQHIDVSQYETALHFLRPVALDYSANRRIWNRMGNRSPWTAPHGVYRCKGEDRWCAITVSSEEEWEAFCRVLGNPAWTRGPRFATLEGRKLNEDELDRLIEEYTIDYTAEEIFQLMQANGVSAGIVEDFRDLFEDPQLQHREFFKVGEHPVIGQCKLHGWPVKLDSFECNPRPAPCLGEHNEYVCRELLKMPEKEFAELVQEGVLK